MKLDQILRERRGKFLSISLERIIDCVITENQKITKVNRVVLPKDMYIKGTYYDPTSECFVFGIFSEKFDPVPTGEKFPKIYDIETISLEIKQK